MFSLETIVAWAKRRAFVFPGSDIYGGLANAWDYGPYGIQLKKNIQDAWWKTFVQERADMVALDAQILMHPKVWEASGHTENFDDPLIDDKNTGERFRADKIIEERIEELRAKSEEKIKGKSVYLIIEKSLIPGAYEKLGEFGELEIREEDKDWGRFVKVYIPQEKEHEFVEFIQKNMKQNEIGHRYTDSCGTSNKVIFSDSEVFDVSTSSGCKQAKEHGILLGIPAEQVDFDIDEKDMLSVSTKNYIDANVLRYIQTNIDKDISNLIPESWTFEQMKDFIDHEIPNNPNSGKAADWTDVRKFSMMFSTHQGVIEDEQNKIRLRPETAQGIFVNFKNILDTTRMRIPFGIAQVGKSFRNEITPGNFLYRTREFEQMEIEYFVKNDLDIGKQAFEDWKEVSLARWKDVIGIDMNNLRLREHEKDELSFYSAGTYDVEYHYPWGWGELQGIAYRTDYDLTRHQEVSGKNMQYTDPYTGERYIPHVIEPSWGLSRAVLAVMFDAYDEEKYIDGNGREQTRVVARFHPNIAPIKFAILPLIKKDKDQVAIANDLFTKLSKKFMCEYDDGGAIGKRYRRQDEIGTPYCITVDQQSVEDGTVTLRGRDSMEQRRVQIRELLSITCLEDLDE